MELPTLPQKYNEKVYKTVKKIRNWNICIQANVYPI